MARFDILSSGGVVRYTGAPTYNGVFGKASYLEFTEIASPTPIAWEVGDYIDYTRTGLRYKLYSIPQPERRARSGAAGDSIVYRNVQLFDATKDLEICPFNDLVMGDNLIHYSSQPDVNTYENVQGIADRIQANLDSFYGSGVWSIRLYSSDADVTAIMSEAKEFSVSDGTCMSALDAIYSTWKGIGWIYTYESGVNVITIGRPNVQDGENSTDLFTYGRGNGLTVLATSLSSQNDLATRIYPFGSTRNMISRYYNSKTTIKDYESVYIPNLMLPITSWGQTDSKYDPRKAYLENTTATNRYGLRVKRIYFDGSNDYEEIYPSIGGVTAKNIRDAKTAIGDSTYVPDSTEYPDSTRMDLIKEVVSQPQDDGIMGDNGRKYIATVTGSSSSATGEQTDIITKMGMSNLQSAPFGNATLTNTGKLTIKSGFRFQVRMPRNSNPDVKFRVDVYVGGSVVKQVYQDAELAGNSTTWYYTLNFQDITFNLSAAGSIFVVVVAEVTAAIGTEYKYDYNAATVTYELQNDFTDQFTIKLKQIGFDISKQQSAISDGLCTLNLKSGNCAGRDFVVKSATYDSEDDSWVVVCYRQEDSSLGQYFPNSIYPIAAGDQFVLTDLEMPELYINMAAARLYDAATALLAKLSAPKIIYEPEIDAKVIAEYGDVLKEGMYMAVGDSELIGNSPVYVLIDTLTIYENESNIPTYKVSLRDERYENTISKLTGEISRLNAQRRASLYDEARNRYMNDTAGEDMGESGVTIIADTTTFSYADASTVNPATIQMMANLINIPSPTYQWQYLDDDTWTNITSATSDQLTVSPSNAQYFANDALVAYIRCQVTSGGNTYNSSPIAITKIVGGQGSSSITMQLYQRASQAPVDKPSGNLVYDFSNDTLTESTTGAFNGWSRQIPTGTDPIYTIIATATTLTTTATFTPQMWGDIRELVRNGEDGTPGTPGTPGAPGEDAYYLQLDPETLIVPTTSALVIPQGTELPTGKATLFKGGDEYDDDDLEYYLEDTDVVFYDGATYNYDRAITPEYHDGQYYDRQFANADGDVLLLADDGRTIWIDNAQVQDFDYLGASYGVSIEESTGDIAVTSNFSFYQGVSVRSVVVVASTDAYEFRRTLTIAAQKSGADGTNGTNGTNGSNGYTSTRIQIYQRSATGTPSKPASNVTYNISSGTITYGSISPWSLTVPSGNDPCYTCFYYLSTNSTSGNYTLFAANWTAPGLLVESDVSLVADKPIVSIPATSTGAIITPTPSVSIQCTFKRGNTPIAGADWFFIDGYITYNSDTWKFAGVVDPDDFGAPSDYIYGWMNVDEDYVLTKVKNPVASSLLWDTLSDHEDVVDTAVKYIEGLTINNSGLISGTPTYISGDSVAVEVRAIKGITSASTFITFEKNKVGERGLAGKVMRGVNVYDANNSFDYQGLDDTDVSHIYYDVVSYTTGGTTKLYYCKIYKKGDTYAKAITPGTDPDVWVEATNFDFVATDLLFAANAYIEYITNKGFYLRDGAGGNVTGGAQGDGSVIFWAGGSNPATAPFRAYADGTMVSTNGIFSGRLMLPFVDVTANKTLSSSDSSSLIIKRNNAGGQSNGYVLTLPNSSDFNGWVLNVYVEPIISRLDGNGKIAGSILVPEKATSSTLQYLATEIDATYGGFFQFMCVSGQWVLMSYNAASVVFTP